MLEFGLWFLAFYVWHMLGVTVGYHRLLSHRSFKCPKFVEYFFVAGGYLALESSPICWAVIHRGHHKMSDREQDPHSPSAGIWDAYAGWMLRFRYTDQICAERIGRDLLGDPIYRFLEQGGSLYRGYFLCALFCVIFRVVLWLTLGPLVALASTLAGIAAQQMPLILNVVSHVPGYGYRNFDTDDQSTNVWWIALLTLGEGWHNNHHAMPSSARMGLRPLELDVSWMVIALLKFLGLATDVRGSLKMKSSIVSVILAALCASQAMAAEVQVIDISDRPKSAAPTNVAISTPKPIVAKPANISHRGGRKWAPENTMEAFRRSVEFGCDGIELDIHKCKSGELVVIHDADVSRTTDGTGSVPDLTYEQLLKFSAGSRMDPKFAKERIPLLSDVLKLVDGKLVLNIEIKNWPRAYQGIDDDLIAMLSTYKHPETILISSFDHEILESIHRKAPQYKLAVLDSSIVYKPKEYMGTVGATYWHPDFHTLRADVVQRAKADGLKVNVWTVNKPEEWQQAVEWGVDGICTDDPEGLRAFLAR